MASASGVSQVGTPTMAIQPPHSGTAVTNQVQSGTTATTTSAVGGTTTTTTNPAGATAAYADTALRDSLPIASEELVERLEEISTQQGSPDAAEDPER